MRQITYIIVTWNNEKEIKKCLESIAKFSSNYEIIVVDNNSEDKTISFIKDFSKNVTLIQEKNNLGFARANNLALSKVKSEYVCFINPDVVLTENIITQSIAVLERNEKIGLVACHLRNKDGSHQQSCFNYFNRYVAFCEILHLGVVFPNIIRKHLFQSHYQCEESFYPDWVIGAEMIMRTEDAKRINGFSTDYFMYTEDMDLCMKIKCFLGKKVYFIADKSLIHLGGASEIQNTNYNKQKKMFQNSLLFTEKYYGCDKVLITKKYMLAAYRIRLLILNSLYFKKDRKFQIDKTLNAMCILKELI